MKPILSKHTDAHVFKDFYWLKKELQQFCRENGISAVGSKIELSTRIESFLETGEIKKPLRISIEHPNTHTQQRKLSLDTIIMKHHRCSQDVRAFFKTAIGPTFHFSTHIQTYFKNNVGKTYRDVVDAWYIEEERKKEPGYKKKISPQFEYNQFVRDFFSDPNNKGKSRKDAIEFWNIIKQLPGNNIYTPDK
ncbi:DUF6434 domain-containing protein [Peribacillus sp. NPDC097295]|uniref:DUF6434 domain-containing protein n=1 Tax=Peribacillus sp. NPDC097295 TaxID=3364402 RepID=UPI00380F2984